MIPRALMHADGTLEFTYRDNYASTRESPVTQVFEINLNGYSNGFSLPWSTILSGIKVVVFADDFGACEANNMAFWFKNCSNLVEIIGFEQASGLVNANEIFANCVSLQSIYASEFDNSSITSCNSCFYNCPALVGGTGLLATTSLHKEGFSLGSGGVLTDPDNDVRQWCYGYIYSDGELVISASAAAELGREVLLSRRVCTHVSYLSVLAIGWNDIDKNSVTKVTFANDMASFTEFHCSYWLYGFNNLTEVLGLLNLHNVISLLWMFGMCGSLESVDFSGFSPDSLENINYVFYNCSKLETIYAGSDWVLPAAGITKIGTFSNCQALVGGYGTAWTSVNVDGAYMRIDTEGSPGYLTVKN